jgi:hypothetical protein
MIDTQSKCHCGLDIVVRCETCDERGFCSNKCGKTHVKKCAKSYKPRVDCMSADQTVTFFKNEIELLRVGNEEENIPLLITSEDRYINLKMGFTQVTTTSCGNGLVALENIPENCLITVYPCDMLEINSDINPIKRLFSSSDMKLAKKFFKDGKHAFDLSENIRIYGNPDITFNHRRAGHFINDPCQDVDIFKRMSILEAFNKYVDDVTQFANTRFVNIDNCVLLVISAKEIKIGDEILIPYDPPYWSGYSTVEYYTRMRTELEKLSEFERSKILVRTEKLAKFYQ